MTHPHTAPTPSPAADTHRPAAAQGITLHSLTVGYRSGKALRTLNRPATEHAACGTLTCLIGPNGAGKSTLLRTIAAFQPPTGGSACVGGRDVAAMSPTERAKAMAVVLTERPSLAHTTVEELVAMGRAPYTGFWGRPTEADRAIVSRALALVGIEPLAARAVATLSDGERQKAMIAKALAQQTPVVLLDEPTAFLDYPSKVEAMLLLARLAHEEHKAVLLSTHDLELALQTADRLWLLNGPAANDGGKATMPDSPATHDGGKAAPDSTTASDGDATAHDGLSVLIGGTPRELAADGSIARFVERSHVAFDAEKLVIKVKG